MGMSISSSRASTVALSQPVNPTPPVTPQPDNSASQAIQQLSAQQQPQLNTDGLIGTLLNTLA